MKKEQIVLELELKIEEYRLKSKNWECFQIGEYMITPIRWYGGDLENDPIEIDKESMLEEIESFLENDIETHYLTVNL
jgi:hypothetical protein